MSKLTKHINIPVDDELHKTLTLKAAMLKVPLRFYCYGVLQGLKDKQIQAKFEKLDRKSKWCKNFSVKGYVNPEEVNDEYCERN